MSKLGFLTDLKDYCVCEHLNLGKRQRVKIGIKADRKCNNKKNNARQKYEFPEKKFQQLERFFLNSPRRQNKQQKNKERSRHNCKPKKMPKQQAEQRSQEDCYGNQQHLGHRDQNRVHGEVEDTQVINSEEKRLQMDPGV